MSSHSDSFVASGSSPTADFIVECHGSIFLLRPLTLAASSWIEEHLPEDRVTFGAAVIVEHRYIAGIVRCRSRRWTGDQMTMDQEKVSLQIRAPLENRLAQVLKIERADLPVLSIAEIVSLLFCLHGHWNIFGGFQETTSSIRALVGEDLFWRRPEVAPGESEMPATVQ